MKFWPSIKNIPTSIRRFYRKYVPTVYDDDWEQPRGYWLK